MDTQNIEEGLKTLLKDKSELEAVKLMEDLMSIVATTKVVLSEKEVIDLLKNLVTTIDLLPAQSPVEASITNIIKHTITIVLNYIESDGADNK